MLIDALIDLLVDARHLHQQAHTRILQFREHLLADDLLDNQRHGDDNARLHVGESCSNNSRGGDARQIIDMAAFEELENKLEGHAVHVCHRQDADDIVTCSQKVFADDALSKVGIAPQRTIRDHHTL